MNYREIEGDLVKLAERAEFDIITHGVNCFSNMGAGIAPQMAKAFGCDKFELEKSRHKGDINKLGQIDYEEVHSRDDNYKLIVVNSYTQYRYGINHADGYQKPIDYEALTLCMRKMNKVFKGKHIGMPKIGSGLAGGNWLIIKSIIQKELLDCKITVVILSE